ncbi:hypothetical protein U1Q18_008241, partial [Sarracenia purpurea var. burkii]
TLLQRTPAVRTASYGVGPSSSVTVQGKSSGTPDLASLHSMLASLQSMLAGHIA